MESVASCSWGHAPKHPAQTQGSSWHSNPLSSWLLAMLMPGLKLQHFLKLQDGSQSAASTA